MNSYKITDEIIFNPELDEKIINLARKYKDDVFYASKRSDEYKALGEAEDNFLKGLKEVIMYDKNEIKWIDYYKYSV